MDIYWNIVLVTVTLSTMEIVLNIGRHFSFNRMTELLNQSTVPSAIVLINETMTIYMLVSERLTDQELKFPQKQG